MPLGRQGKWHHLVPASPDGPCAGRHHAFVCEREVARQALKIRFDGRNLALAAPDLYSAAAEQAAAEQQPRVV